MIFAKDAPQGVRNLAESGARFDGRDDRRHEVRPILRGRFDPRNRRLPGIVTAARPYGAKPLDLLPLDLGIDVECLDGPSKLGPYGVWELRFGIWDLGFGL